MTFCPTCQTEIQQAQDSLGNPIIVQPKGMYYVPTVRRDGEVIMALRHTFERHECRVRLVAA